MEPISIELPHNDNIFRKRKKKGFDVEAWVRRELGRAQRELQMLKHQTHVLCLIGHLKYLNSFASDHDSTELLLATAMSVIPPTYSVPAKDLDMVRLAAFVSWFKSAFQVLFCYFHEKIPQKLIFSLSRFYCSKQVFLMKKIQQIDLSEL